MVDESYKVVGLISITMLWLGFVVVLKMWPGDKSMSISEHVARHRKAQILLAVNTIVSLALFFLFAVRWLMPKIGLSDLFLVALIVTLLSQIIAVLIPEVGDKQGRVHRQFAHLGAIMWFVLLTLIALSPSLPLYVTRIAYLFMLIMIMIGALFKIRTKTYEYQLMYQMAYYLTFDIALLFVTYTV